MSFPRSFGHGDAVVCSRRPSMAEKGHFVVYSADGKRFVLPLAYLKNKIIRQLFRLAEEEFGLHSNGPLTLPCDANYMECVISLVRSHVSKDVEKAFIFPDMFRLYSKLSAKKRYTTPNRVTFPVKNDNIPTYVIIFLF